MRDDRYSFDIEKIRNYRSGVLQFYLAMLLGCSGCLWGQWQQTAGPQGKPVYQILSDMSGHLYTVSGKDIYYSNDLGEHWQFRGSLSSEISEFFITPGNQLLAAGNKGLFRSLDGGQTWQHEAAELITGTIHCFTLFGKLDILAADYSERIFHFSTAEKAWSEINYTLPEEMENRGDHKKIEFLRCNSQKDIFMLYTNYLLRSTDSGASWEIVAEPSAKITSLYISPEDHLWAGTSAYGILFSKDNGDKWLRSAPPSNLINNFRFIQGDGKVNIVAAAVSMMLYSDQSIPDSTLRSLPVRHSKDGPLTTIYLRDGKSFNWPKQFQINGEIRSFLYDRQATVYAGTANSFTRYNFDDGNRSIFHIPNGNVQAVAAIADDILLAGSPGAGLTLSGNKGDSWQTLSDKISPSKLQGPFVIAENSIGDVFTTFSSTLYHWQKSQSGLRKVLDLPGDMVVMAMVIDNSNRIFLGSARNGIYLISEAGQPPQPLALPGQSILTMLIDAQGNILAGSNKGIFKSADGGSTWQQSNFPPKYIWSMAFSDKGDLFAVAGQLYRSRDNGDSWQPLELPGGDIRLCYAKAGHLLAASGKSIFYSQDNGDSWQEFNQGLHHNGILSLSISPQGMLFAGTSGGGLYRRQLAPAQ